MILVQQHPINLPFLNLTGDKVDKRSNRKTPGTSGDGPRPPRRNEYPDQEDDKPQKKKKKE
ncbi:hypothetical protein [Cyclobacterium sp.]|uniref:hypothetical protein n=1 Tax=Cyclobacterium sp. TaxID=1966343 RepID=UPI001987C10F|nr:hypothetical protein [Cyclobacterium sp.]MBD3630340.1 hypothetical protein [Cyclobacterium sp.]